MTATAGSKTVSHFADVSTAPPDSILGLMDAFAADTNPNKMNLSVGVYKDAAGLTPILKCVKAAEKRLVETEQTKGYLPIDGVAEYREHVRQLVFGDALDAARVAMLQAPGGTGALRVAAGFVATQLAVKKIWIPDPTWANHGSIFAAEGVAMDQYRYLASCGKQLDFDGLIDDLKNNAGARDAVLLHACCHNPTGVDPTAEQWRQIAAVCAEKQLLPVVDFAYQGFGQGLVEDTSSIQTLLQACDELLVCSSFSKNFGLYSERVGALAVVTANAATTSAVQSQLKSLVRSNYSNPPRHGASIVATVLGDGELTKLWHEELTEMRTRIKSLREQFVTRMKTCGAGHDFSFLLAQNGMFSYSGLNKMQVDELKSKYGIYIVGSGRINVAGMSERRMDQFCTAVAEVLES